MVGLAVRVDGDTLVGAGGGRRRLLDADRVPQVLRLADRHLQSGRQRLVVAVPRDLGLRLALHLSHQLQRLLLHHRLPASARSAQPASQQLSKYYYFYYCYNNSRLTTSRPGQPG